MVHVDGNHDDSSEEHRVDGNVLHDDDIITEVQVVPVPQWFKSSK